MIIHIISISQCICYVDVCAHNALLISSLLLWQSNTMIRLEKYESFGKRYVESCDESASCLEAASVAQCFEDEQGNEHELFVVNNRVIWSCEQSLCREFIAPSQISQVYFCFVLYFCVFLSLFLFYFYSNFFFGGFFFTFCFFVFWFECKTII